MSQAPDETEEARLGALRQYRILDTPRESDFDDLVELAAQICDTPISLVSLVDKDRQWFKGRHGLDITETPRRLSFCSHAIQEPERTMVVEDAAKDPRFAGNALVTSGPKIRFYAGAPLVTPEGYALGTLCVIDRKPRKLTAEQQNALRILTRQVVTQLELRRRVAELSRTSESLRDSNQELEGFSYAVTHDLRAPLRATIGYSQILLRTHAAGLDEKAAHLLEEIERSGQRTVQILEDFTRLLRLRSQPLTMTALDMQSLTEEIVHELQPSSPATVFHIGALPQARGDPGLVRQVLVNLICNAIKFSRDRNPPQVDIEGMESLEHVQFSVKDNGTGFDMRDVEKLWRPFHRLHGKEFEGTGLGLSVVRRVVRRHGGDVWAEASPGQGAAFFFTLPCETVSARLQEAKARN